MQWNRFDHDELKEVMDLCISCKACQSECPSNVDMSTLKAEFQHQYYKSNKRPLRSKLFSNINSLNKLGSYFPWLYNSLLSNSLSSKISKQILGIASERNLPTISKVSLRSWYNKHYKGIAPQKPIKELFLFCDEFSNFQDVNIGIKTIELLCRLGYAVNLIKHKESGRAAISKGMLSKAKKCAESNVRHFHDLISEEKPLIGIEPSAILSFRDEYPRIVSASLQSKAEELAKSCFTIEEFISNETKKGLIKSSSFHEEQKQIIVHGHCHQKALSDVTLWILSLPSGYIVSEISSGCCGMAGSFGYEKEHFDVSRKIANLSLVPAINSASDNTVIIAAGTSCRHQIYDFTKRNAMHPVELLHAALI